MSDFIEGESGLVRLASDTEVFLDQEQGAVSDVVKKAIEAEGYYASEFAGGVYAPKTWFNDPFSMLDGIGVGYKNSPSSIGYPTLASMAEKAVVPAAIIQTRVNQVASFSQQQRNKYSIGWLIRHRNPKHKLTDGNRERIRELEFFIEHMGIDEDPERDNFDTFLRKVVRDRLTYDQLCAEKVPRRNGKPHSVHAVDASTIRIAAPPKKTGHPLTRYEQMTVPKYLQIINGEVVNDYLRSEMIFRIANPRSDIRSNGYGMAELELLITTVTAHLWAEEWNRRVFSQGATVKGILNLSGNIKPQVLEAFRRQWITQVSGVTNAWRSPVMNAENLQWIPLQPSNSEMGYQQWMEYLIKIASAVFLIDPAEINFDIRGGVGNQPMFMSTNEAQQKVSKDRGLQPLLRFVQTMMNEEIIYKIDPDFEFAFVGLDSKTEEQAIELRMKEVSSYKTLNEIRREADDLPPLEEGDVPMNPVYFTAKQIKMTAEQQQQQQMAQMQQAPGGQPGQPQGQQAPPQKGGGKEAPDEDTQAAFEKMFAKAMPAYMKSRGSVPKRACKKCGSTDSDMRAGLCAKCAFPKGVTKGDERSEEETSEDWESTIHASLTKKSKRALKKALSRLSEF